MREDKKEARRLEKLLAALGIDAPVPTGPSTKQQKMTTSREAEAVIEYVKNAKVFVEKACAECGKRFAVNRGNVDNCSDLCRAKALNKLGVIWDWSKKPELRWSVRYQDDELTNEPLIVPEEALDIVAQVLGSTLQRNMVDVG